MKRYACYCMTRNIYHKVWPSLNSLLQHSSVDKVYLLTEDDDIGFELPRNVEVVNVSGQKYFSPDGPNYHTQWTWMLLMRTALAKVLPNVDRILSLDLDTIVVENIDELWELSIDGYYLAACKEPKKSNGPVMYINGGVVLWNLAKMRDGKCDEMISALNEKLWLFPDQTVISHLCNGKIYQMNSMYNACFYTDPTKAKKIIHFAANTNWYEKEQLVQMYKEKNHG